MACTRKLFLDTRELSPRPVVPLSPVRVAICVKRCPMGCSFGGWCAAVLHFIVEGGAPAFLGRLGGRGLGQCVIQKFHFALQVSLGIGEALRDQAHGVALGDKGIDHVRVKLHAAFLPELR